MRTVAFLVSCLSSIGYAQRVQGSLSEESQRPLNLIDKLAQSQGRSTSQLGGNLKQWSALASLLLAYKSAAAFNPVLVGNHRAACGARSQLCNVLMKGKKKGVPYEGGKPLKIPILDESEWVTEDDRVSMETLLKRLKEVPVFAIRTAADVGDKATEDGYWLNEDGFVQYYMAPAECELDRKMLFEEMGEADREKTEIVTNSLDKVIFAENIQLKPSKVAIQDVLKIPRSNSMVDSVRVPVFCIDGLVTRDKNTGESEMPIFFSRQGCIDMARDVIPGAASQVLLGDLSILIANMLNGPAGPLKDAAFLADNSAYTAWRRLSTSSESIFGEKPQEGGLGQIFRDKLQEAAQFKNPFR
mmetsp:Transcript_10741/g.20015  ORF Transcript_10741/g.20015 Transcript_10741/m.20015 type:complete len:357 (-) Transcript_10741:114-1184(-)